MPTVEQELETAPFHSPVERVVENAEGVACRAILCSCNGASNYGATLGYDVGLGHTFDNPGDAVKDGTDDVDWGTEGHGA